jgi:phosphoglycolate phosphatase
MNKAVLFICLSILIILPLVYFYRESHDVLSLTNRDLSKSKVLIFDFDGTICDSYLASMKVINALADEYAYRKMDETEFGPMRDLSMQIVLKSLDITSIKLPFIVRRIRKELNKEIDHLPIFDGMKEALSALKGKGYALGILTSNSEENIMRFLKNNNIEHFDFIYSGSSLFGKDKVIKNLLKNIKADTKSAIYIGDETRDIEGARGAGIPMIAVTWGFNSRTVLESFHPDHVIDSPLELSAF